ncbi:hypothetical protein HC928_03190, partial [bacterium]|nr:hypothetical protein [bacterium]
MQVGDIIQGKNSRYRILRSLGRPGLYGQAFLCQEEHGDAEYVVKALRSSADEADQKRLSTEADTLRRVAKVEEEAKVRYAVRLIDQNHEGAPEPFIVLERATGQNVQEDLIETVPDWYKQPLDEQLALDIAWRFAHALSFVHQAGLAYNDMKLDNLFWRADRPGDPLRIIDWNVTTELKGKPEEQINDWARFGARLYALRTGIPISLDSKGNLVGNRPSGYLWDALPYGIRAFIERALNQGYQKDEEVLAVLERERKQSKLAWSQLIAEAEKADEQHSILAPLWRAEQQLTILPETDPQREQGLQQVAQLRQAALARQGKVSAERFEVVRNLLTRGDRGLALEEIQRMEQSSGERDAQVRRWRWVVDLSMQQNQTFNDIQEYIFEALDAFQREDYTTARTKLSAACLAWDPTPNLLQALYHEAGAREYWQQDKPQDALEDMTTLHVNS